MNPKLILSLAIVFCSFSIAASAEKDASFPILTGPYLGQKPPGMVPEVFAPGFISTEQFEFGITFSRDGKECFFTRRPTFEGSDNRIYHSQWIDGRWSRPTRASFAADVFEFIPIVSVNGEKLFFYSERPKPQDTDLDGNLWLVEKKGSGWGEGRFFQAPANRKYCMMVSEAKNGTIYFSGIFAGKRGMFRAACQAGEYGEMERLPEEINAIRPAHPFIAPDESYLIMDAQVAGMGQPELFISFRKADGGWTRALNMGQAINATKTEFAASVSPDGKFLFFHRRVNGNGDIYWVDAGIIDELRAKISD
jgi:hypothetical protein